MKRSIRPARLGGASSRYRMPLRDRLQAARDAKHATPAERHEAALDRLMLISQEWDINPRPRRPDPPEPA